MSQYKGECLCGACRYVITETSLRQCTYAIVADVEKRQAIHSITEWLFTPFSPKKRFTLLCHWVHLILAIHSKRHN